MSIRATRATMPPASMATTTLRPLPTPGQPVAYTADSWGAAQVSEELVDFNLHEIDRQPVFGRAIVVHGGGARAGCGIIGGAFGVTSAIAVTSQYPGYSGSHPNVKAMAVLRTVDGVLTMRAVVVGLEANAVGGIHIHAGFDCSAASGSLGVSAGGHYFDGLSVDPWTTTYSSDGSGVAFVEMVVADFSLEGVRPVAGRTIVVHTSTGTRAACGVITPTKAEVAVLKPYPSIWARGSVA